MTDCRWCTYVLSTECLIQAAIKCNINRLFNQFRKGKNTSTNNHRSFGGDFGDFKFVLCRTPVQCRRSVTRVQAIFILLTVLTVFVCGSILVVEISG